MDMPDYDAFFRTYAQAYERSLGPSVDRQAIRSVFAEHFISAGVNGEVAAGSNDEIFDTVLLQAYEFYKTIGTRGMKVERVEADVLYDHHDRVRVYYRAEYRKKDGSDLTIPFDVLYLLQRRPGGPKIFAFIAGDEMHLYKQHGLVNDKGEPAG